MNRLSENYEENFGFKITWADGDDNDSANLRIFPTSFRHHPSY